MSKDSPSSGFQNKSLSIKITGVVFWGTVLIGLLVSFVVLSGLESELREHHKNNIDHFHEMINDEIQNHKLLSNNDKIHDLLSHEGLRMGFDAITIDVDGKTYTYGNKSSNSTEVKKIFTFENKSYYVTVAQKSLEASISERRKQIIAGMGILFAVFGLILQWILQKWLAVPFLNMVKTAQAISKGNADTRFDEKSTDEFGYLGKFINEALESLHDQQDKLKDAIKKEHKSRELAEVTLHSIADAVITTNSDGKIEYCNPTAEKLLGKSYAETHGKNIENILNLVDYDTGQPVSNPVIHCLKTAEMTFREENIVLVREDGQEIDIHETTSPIRDPKGNVIGAVLVFHDVSHSRKMARQLTYQATHDSLTGLYNRHEFENRLLAALKTTKIGGEQHSLCYMDLDQFKVVNDSCGHLAGDQLLCQVSDILRDKVRDTDVLARLGGDEFGVLLMGCNLDSARIIAEKCRESLTGYRFKWEEQIFEVGISIGVVALSSDSPNQTISDVLTAADIACYAAKDSGRNRVHLFEANDAELKKRHNEMRWVSRIHKALDDDRFEIYYQDIVPTNPSKNKLHREFLVRMLDEEGNIVPPMSFIPAAERFNLMTNIDKWVISRGLHEFKRHSDSGKSYICSINISGQSLTNDDFLNFIVNEIESSGVEPNNICFEITETCAIANMSRATKLISIVKEMGCKFALDDFGSGLSSFAYLKNMNVDFLKIDGCFVKNILTDPVDHAMVKSITQVGHVMNLQTIAEFVESEDIMAELKRIGVDYGQGYGLGKPMPLSTILPYEVKSDPYKSNNVA